MKKQTAIDSHIKLLKDIIVIIVGILTIITLSISIGVIFGRNAAIIEMNKTVTQLTIKQK